MADYIQKNSESTIDLFAKRSIYFGQQATNNPAGNFIDFNFGEKFLYGRVDRLYRPIVPDREQLKIFHKTQTKSRGTMAFNFVVDAFNEMAVQFQKCANRGQINANDPFLSNLKVYRAHLDPERNYAAYRKLYQKGVQQAYSNQDINVENFNHFTDEAMASLGVTARTTPYTFPAWVKSRQSSIMSSGLAIEIADLDPVNDEAKVKEFMSSLNWDFFVQTCASYGFTIDRFVPWRIVADIGSAAMVEYAKAYGFGTTDSILTYMYIPAYRVYPLNTFKVDMLQFYNTVKSRMFMKRCDTKNSSITVRVYPQNYTLETLAYEMSEEEFLNYYFKIRFLEEESQFSENEHQKLVDDCLEIYYSKGTTQAVENFERMINKPFDYRGALTYNLRAYQERQLDPNHQRD